MAETITKITRCAGGNHLMVYVSTPEGERMLQMTVDDFGLQAAPIAEEDLRESIIAEVEKAKLAGATDIKAIETAVIGKVLAPVVKEKIDGEIKGIT